MSKTLRALLVAVAASLAACQSAPPPLEAALANPGDAGEYRLGSGDKVRVIVFGQEQLSGEFAVDGAGRVAMPLVGEIDAKGLSARELEKRIAQRLSEGYVKDARVSAEVLTFRPFYVIGEVNNPGQFPYASGMTALNAIAMAGGHTYRGRQDYVVITRTIDGKKQERQAPANTPILPDDVVQVPERLF
ncbi:MAG TPA: polysaccharide biosynthesis/export family protein [Azospirillaceae bacterium]|nr:polysaccharide biosynthesis/export family protein [Azospirillaceae bacterium]